jgi:hypothetical protein
MKHQLLIITAVLSSMLGSCSDSNSSIDSPTNFDRFTAIAKAIRISDRLTLLEGLPHPGWEEKEFVAEQERVTSILIHGHAFYPGTIQPSADDMQVFRELFTSSEALRPYGGAKRCGQFHADWCFEWQNAVDTYQCLLCFNCGEIKCFGKAPALHCDISAKHARSLKSMLEKYRSNRPKGGMYDLLLVD